MADHPAPQPAGQCAPSGSATATTALLTVAGFSNDLRYVELTQRTLAQMQSMMSQYPLGFGQWLQALSFAISKPREIAIIGESDAQDTKALLAVARNGYQPFQVIAQGPPTPERAAVPLLQDRYPVDGGAAAYVCFNFACQAPVTGPEALRFLLERPGNPHPYSLR